MPATQLIPSFNAGELSPLIHFRSDLEKYRYGCRTLRNMTLTPYGGAKRRAGLSYTATAPGKTRLETFQVAIDKSFILELSALQMRFYQRGDIVQASGGGDYTVTTPYTDDDLFGIDIKQINNVAYFVHPDYPPYKLIRVLDNLWTFAAVDFSYPGMLTENLDDSLTISTSAQADAGTTITLTSSSDLFQTLHVGAFWELSHERPKNQFESKKGFSSSGTSPEIVIQGAYRFSTSGTWSGTATLQRNDGTGWEDVAQYSSSNDANFDVERVQEDRVRMRINYSGSGGGYGLIDTTEPYIVGLVKVTRVDTATSVQAEVIRGVEAGATEVWREGAWSGVQGYPRAVAAHEQRLIFGGTESQPQTIWASAIDDYENFEPGNDDDNSWTHTLVSGQSNDIQWLVSQKALLVGTTGDEWVLAATKEDGVITPTNVRARRHSNNGSDNISPILLDDSAIFVQRGGKVMRDMSYSFESDGYKTEELTLLAEHITGLGIVDIALQTQPEQVIWAVTADGRLLGLTYDKSQNVAGWHRHTTGATGVFESVTVRKTNNEDDQIWVVVKRTINGSEVRYVERIKPDGFFLEEPWSLQYQSIYGMTPWVHIDDLAAAGTGGLSQWEAEIKSYAEGDTVGYLIGGGWTEDEHNLFRAMNAHESVGGILSQTTYSSFSLPLTGAQNWLKCISWVYTNLDTGISYGPSGSGSFTVNDYHYHNGKIYQCTTFHTASSPGAGTTEPGVGSSWASYWTDTGWTYPQGAVPEYEQYLTDYALNDVVVNDDVRYKCILAHTSEPSFEPGVGGSWTTYWVAEPYHEVDDEVVAGGLPYKAILDHDPSATTEPGVGATWETYWELIQTDYVADELASEAGFNYKCILTHTPSADKRPRIGANWETYWELQTDEENLDFYVDSGVTLINPGAITEVTGLTHLEGETVQVYANGAVLKDRAVSSGAIQLNLDGDPTTYTHISVGLAYESLIEPMAIEQMLKNGPSAGREKRISELILFFNQSYSCKIGTSISGDFDLVRFYDGENVTPQLFDGQKECRLDARHTRDATFILKQDLPMPFHLLAVSCKFEIYGDKM